MRAHQRRQRRDQLQPEELRRWLALRLVPRIVATNAGWLSRCSEIAHVQLVVRQRRADQVVAVDVVER